MRVLRKLFILVGLLLSGIANAEPQRLQQVSQANAPEGAKTAATDEGMEYVTLCNPQHECKKFSRLIMGTDHVAQGDWVREGQPQPSEAEVFKVFDEAAKLGINFFDTSPIYVGDAENKLGLWMKSRRELFKRDDFYYGDSLNPDRKVYALSKGGFPFDLFWAKKLKAGTHSPELKSNLSQQGILAGNATPAADGTLPLTNVPPGTYASRLYGNQEQIQTRVAEEMAHSMANLNNEITVYLMHRDDVDFVSFEPISRQQTPVKTIMEALSVPNLAEKYWALGWSNWETSRVNESIRIAEQDSAFVQPVFNSPYFSLFEMSSRSIHAGGVQVTHQEMMNPQFQQGIKFMPYSPLGGFSILDQPEPKWENAKRAAKEKFDKGDAYWQNVYPALFTDANQARWERVLSFTQQFNDTHSTNYTVDQMINAYALAHKRTDFLAIGPVTIEQVRRTVASLRLARMLTPKDVEYLYSGNQQ